MLHDVTKTLRFSHIFILYLDLFFTHNLYLVLCSALFVSTCFEIFSRTARASAAGSSVGSMTGCRGVGRGAVRPKQAGGRQGASHTSRLPSIQSVRDHEEDKMDLAMPVGVGCRRKI